ncbi:hypothetical protein [Aquipseudomonas alcaligenes]|uniref:Uncharacterized protein n=1 Tax=Aquipseudomonas alcaligenes TaxID=43263 RepID=A0AA42MX94_AQUAC|nr:hypothetical protein [Pseudomonas alcaligenes]MDH1053150.1 hypothetical protein [Pseudomonas alcaligenes]
MGDQTEVDHCWARLGEGGVLQGQQIAMATPAGGALEILLSEDQAVVQPATQAMLQMKRLDIAALQRAFVGESQA